MELPSEMQTKRSRAHSGGKKKKKEKKEKKGKFSSATSILLGFREDANFKYRFFRPNSGGKGLR